MAGGPSLNSPRVYQIESDFKDKVEGEFGKMIEDVSQP